MMELMPGMKEDSQKATKSIRETKVFIEKGDWISAVCSLEKVQDLVRNYRESLPIIKLRDDYTLNSLEKKHCSSRGIFSQANKRGGGRFFMPRKSKHFEEAQKDFLNKITEIVETGVLDETFLINDVSIKELEDIIRKFENIKSDFTTLSRLLMNEMRDKIRNIDKEQTKKIRINKGVIR